MVAPLAREDYEDLVSAGLKPTLDDFDRLNQLAQRLQCGAEVTPANAPRIGWAGDVPFHEPTAAAIMWLTMYAERVPCDAETQQSFFFFACAHAKQPDVLMKLEKPDDIEKAVKAWLRTVPATSDEMERACHYAAWGFDDAVAAKPDVAQRKDKAAAADNLDRLERNIAIAAGICGFPYADLMASTPSRLNAMVVAAQIEGGLTVSHNMARAQADYTRTLSEIRNRLIAEKESANG